MRSATAEFDRDSFLRWQKIGSCAVFACPRHSTDGSPTPKHLKIRRSFTTDDLEEGVQAVTSNHSDDDCIKPVLNCGRDGSAPHEGSWTKDSLQSWRRQDTRGTFDQLKAPKATLQVNHCRSLNYCCIFVCATSEAPLPSFPLGL